MGGGGYSHTRATQSRVDKGTHHKSVEQNFTAREVSPEMNPHGIQLRESCDSDEHPNSLAIIIGLDVTASMGYVPQYLVQDGLPHIVGSIIEHGEPDPQVLFLGVGDHKCDRGPLQIGQFESSDEKLDHWLENTWLEGGGGGNGGESYHLAWYFAAKHTSIDCMKKRGRKGLLFTIGDEPIHKDLPAAYQKALMGPGEYLDTTAANLLQEAQENYDVYHIHVASTNSWREDHSGWKELLGERFIVAESEQAIAKIIIDITTAHEDVAASGSSGESVNDKPYSGAPHEQEVL